MKTPRCGRKPALIIYFRPSVGGGGGQMRRARESRVNAHYRRVDERRRRRRRSIGAVQSILAGHVGSARSWRRCQNLPNSTVNGAAGLQAASPGGEVATKCRRKISASKIRSPAKTPPPCQSAPRRTVASPNGPHAVQVLTAFSGLHISELHVHA